MKISEMLQREDFYAILPETFNQYAAFLGIEPGSVAVVGKGEKANLFVNEKLNAILAARPSGAVKAYLKTEYTVGGNALRKVAVAAYLKYALTCVRGNSQRGLRCDMKSSLNDVLIYPCNKKIRLFDFKEGVVYTVLKTGFPDIYIKRETKFRQDANVPFVPKILSCMDGCYSERIIENGRPLARIQDGGYVERKKQESLRLVQSLTTSPKRVRAKEYVAGLRDRCLTMLKNKNGFESFERVEGVFERLTGKVTACEIGLVTSHGDFQPGNIWIDKDGEIVIIDWETVKERSPYYDYAALYCSLRNHGGLNNLCERIKANKHLNDNEDCPIQTVLALILAEELEYQTEELISFPGKMGLAIYENQLKEFESIRL